MNLHSLWTILIKLIGIYLLSQLIYTIASAAQVIWYLNQSFRGDPGVIGLLVLTSVISSTLFVLVIRTCLFRSDWVIAVLNLEDGFEEKQFNFKFSQSAIVSIALIILGGIFMANAIVSLGFDIPNYFKQRNLFPLTGSSLPLFVTIGKGMAGYLLIVFHKNIAMSMERKTNYDSPGDQPEE